MLGTQNVISLKTNFLLRSLCSLHRPCEVCVLEIDERFLVYQITSLLKNDAAFRCVFAIAEEHD